MLLLGAIVVLVCGVGFFELMEDLYDGEVDQFDLMLMQRLGALRSPGWTWFMSSTTDLGSVPVLALLTLGVAGGLWLSSHRGMAGALVVAMAGALGLSSALKAIVHRARPSVVEHLEVAQSYAFPSGHTIGSVVFFVTLALLVARHVPARRLRVFLVGYALLVGAVVALSRVYLGVHHPSDVASGALLGIAWAVLVVMAEHLWRHGRATRATG